MSTAPNSLRSCTPTAVSAGMSPRLVVMTSDPDTPSGGRENLDE